MARFNQGDRIRYTGPTTLYLQHGDTGTVTKATREFVFANWDNSPSEVEVDWCAAPQDVHREGATWLERNWRAIVVGALFGTAVAVTLWRIGALS